MPANCRLCLGLFALLGVGGVLYILAPVLTPFLLAALLAYLGDPVADRLETWGLPRTAAVVVVFVAFAVTFVLLLVLLVPMLQRQFAILVERVPLYLDLFQTTVLPRLADFLGIEGPTLDLSMIKNAIAENWGKAGSVLERVLLTVTRSGALIAAWLANLLLVPVVAFYLLRDWDVMVVRVANLLPRRAEPIVSGLARECDEVLGAFLRGQLLVMVALALVYSTGLWIIGLDLALLIGSLSGVVSFVPYLGFFVGIVAAGLAAWMQFQDIFAIWPVFVVFGAGQALEGMVLTPLLVGDKIGLHPVAVIFAILVGGQLFGFFGILLALPAAAIIMVLLRHTHDEYMRSAFYGRAESPAESEES